MTRTRWIWLVLAIVYAVAFGWYTSFGGPLQADEIDHYLGLLESREPAPPPEALATMRKFMEEDTGDDFVMVNVIDMYDTPLQIEGVEPGRAATTCSRSTWSTCSRRCSRGPAIRCSSARPPTTRWT